MLLVNGGGGGRRHHQVEKRRNKELLIRSALIFPIRRVYSERAPLHVKEDKTQTHTETERAR